MASATRAVIAGAAVAALTGAMAPRAASAMRSPAGSPTSKSIKYMSIIVRICCSMEATTCGTTAALRARPLTTTTMSALGVVPWRERITESIARSRKIRGGNYVQLASVDAAGAPHVRTARDVERTAKVGETVGQIHHALDTSAHRRVHSMVVPRVKIDRHVGPPHQLRRKR